MSKLEFKFERPTEGRVYGTLKLSEDTEYNVVKLPLSEKFNLGSVALINVNNPEEIHIVDSCHKKWIKNAYISTRYECVSYNSLTGPIRLILELEY